MSRTPGVRSRFVEASSGFWTCGTDNLAATASISGESYNCTITAGCEPAWAHRGNRLLDRDLHGPRASPSRGPNWTKSATATASWDARTLPGRPGKASKKLSVADLRAVEGRDGAADFRVTIGQAQTGRVTVDYATVDGAVLRARVGLPGGARYADLRTGRDCEDRFSGVAGRRGRRREREVRPAAVEPDRRRASRTARP